MVSGKTLFDQPGKNDLRTYDNRKIATGQRDDYTTCCLLDDHFYLKNCYKMIAIDFSKQEALDADPKAVQQINFIVKSRSSRKQCFSLLKKQKKLFWIFQKELWKYCKFISLWYNINIYNFALNITL